MNEKLLAIVLQFEGSPIYKDWCFTTANMSVLKGMASNIENQLPLTATTTGKPENAKPIAKLILTFD